MTYSKETMERMEASIANAGNALLGVGVAAEEAAEIVGNFCDHYAQCCREHGTHANPHRGCILR